VKRRACSIAANAMTSFVLYCILLLTIWSKAITAQESINAKSGVTIMASSKEYLHFILEQLSDLDDVSYRPMMGEYILYYRGKIIGGIYDDRLLVKKTRSALELMPAVICEFPYEGAKEMLLVDEVDSKEFLTELFEAMYNELPLPKQKRKNSGVR
jgi:TfoX/Sxy family transcriptional regulator of competence genes